MAVKFISNEYIIYLLKQQLCDTSAFTSLEYWAYTECLAEFYLSKLFGQTDFFKELQYIIDFYNNKYSIDNQLSPFELYQLAINEFSNNTEI